MMPCGSVERASGGDTVRRLEKVRLGEDFQLPERWSIGQKYILESYRESGKTVCAPCKTVLSTNLRSYVIEDRGTTRG
jgi:hypothetical protein